MPGVAYNVTAIYEHWVLMKQSNQNCQNTWQICALTTTKNCIRVT